MTDHYYSIGVVLEKDIRDDDAECILNAIRMVKGVLSVEPNIADLQSAMAESRARKDIADKIWEILYPKINSK